MPQLNPYRDSSPWGDVTIGGALVPGIVLAIDGAERPEEWDVQKPTNKSGAATVWKGTNVADDIKIRIALTTAQHVDDYRALGKHLRPKLGKKPPVHSIKNAIVNWSEITRVSCRNVSPPRWQTSGGYWIGEVTLIDFSPPKPTNTGAAKASDGSTAGTFARTKVDPNLNMKLLVGELKRRAKKI